MKRRPLFPAAVRRKRRLATATAAGQRVMVKARAPWPLRALMLLVILALGAALGSGLYEYALRLAGVAPQVSSSELAQLRGEHDRLVADNQLLQNRLSAADGRIEIERAANAQLAAELRLAQKESGDLRNDLAFFEQLIPGDPRSGQVSIRSAELERQGQALRYRVLLMRGGRPSGEFRGQLQFSASGTRGGTSATIDLQPFVPASATVSPGAPGTLPEGNVPASNPLVLSFRQYQRAEGMLDLPTGFVAKSITVRVLEGGAVRSQSTVNLPA